MHLLIYIDLCPLPLILLDHFIQRGPNELCYLRRRNHLLLQRRIHRLFKISQEHVMIEYDVFVDCLEHSELVNFCGAVFGKHHLN